MPGHGRPGGKCNPPGRRGERHASHRPPAPSSPNTTRASSGRSKPTPSNKSSATSLWSFHFLDLWCGANSTRRPHPAAAPARCVGRSSRWRKKPNLPSTVSPSPTSRSEQSQRCACGWRAIDSETARRPWEKTYAGARDATKEKEDPVLVSPPSCADCKNDEAFALEVTTPSPHRATRGGVVTSRAKASTFLQFAGSLLHEMLAQRCKSSGSVVAGCSRSTPASTARGRWGERDRDCARGAWGSSAAAAASRGARGWRGG